MPAAAVSQSLTRTATPRMRASDAPNRLVEDTRWRYLLCAACEGLLSRDEAQVARAIFIPMHEERESRFRYGPSFARFAVSVAWRALVVSEREGTVGTLGNDAVAAAEQTWRDFLLRRRRTPSPHDVHVLPLDVPVQADLDDFSPHLGRFLLRNISVATQAHGQCGYIVVKMCRLLVFGVVAPGNERSAWKGTKLHVDGGSFGVDRYHAPGWVLALIKKGAQLQQEAVEGLSARQKQLTHDALMKAIEADPTGLAESGSVKAFEKDLELFGPAAFQRPADGKD